VGPAARQVTLRITHIGGPTTLLEVDGWRLLTDPTFDPPGRRYAFGWDTSSRKLDGPAVADVGPVDAVLLTHDHHGDNLDDAGRALLAGAPRVVTTVPGARRVGGTGLKPWSATRLDAAGKPTITVTATPCRHGPPLSRPIAGAVIGFALNWEGQRDGALWISGDTVLYGGVRAVADRVPVDVAVLHLGAVGFPITGPLRYSMTGEQAVELCSLLRPRVAVPVHYAGWAHFREGRAEVEAAFRRAPEDVRSRVRWLEPGVAAQVS